MATEEMNVSDILRRVREFEADAHKVLGKSEAAPSRIVMLSESFARVSALSVNQDDMLRQAIRCVEVEVFRAAHVLSWAAAIDYLQESAAADGFADINAARPKWGISSLEELRENNSEYSVVEAMHAAKLITKTEKKAFHGLLSRRNECAHPSGYYPDLNQSLGFISEIISRIDSHKKRTASKS